MNIKELAKKAGIDVYDFMDITKDELDKFAELVAAHEREECAKLCDYFQARDVGFQPAECAGAIRARSKA
jgi:energy-converting hydrogenase A subunit M